MKILIFGSCSGTEPFADRHHTSFAMELNNRIYWFDAGENCSYTAYLMGVDLHAVSDIFISHPHMDHVGGLGNLLWNIRKLSAVNNSLPHFDGVRVYSPNMQTLNAVLTILKQAEGNYQTSYPTTFKKVFDGVLMENNDIQVEAIHNNHLVQTSEGWQSFSFRIHAENKKLVYSGDIAGVDDLDEFLKDGCDALLMETGHHAAEDICRYIVEKQYLVKSIYFLHHGRRILHDFDGELQRCKDVFPNVYFCNDKDVFTI